MPLFDDYLNNPDSQVKFMTEDAKTVQSQFAHESQEIFTQPSQRVDYNSL